MVSIAESLLALATTCVKSSKISPTSELNIRAPVVDKAQMIRKKAYTAAVSPNINAKH